MIKVLTDEQVARWMARRERNKTVNLSEASSLTGMFFLPIDHCPRCESRDLYRDILGMVNCDECGWDQTEEVNEP